MPDRPELPDTATLDAIEDAQTDLGAVTAYRVLGPAAGAEGAHLMAVNNPTGRFQLGELSLRLERVVDLCTEERLASVRVTRLAPRSVHQEPDIPCCWCTVRG